MNSFYPQYGQTNGIVWVNNDQEVINHLMLPNSAVTLRSNDGKTVYFKTTDPSGRASIEVYTLTPRVQETPPAPDYVTRKEFEELIARLKAREEKAE